MIRGRDIYGPGFWKGGPGRPAPWGWWGAWGGHCWLYPWLPRRWWAYPAASTVPSWWPWAAGAGEAEFLKLQAEVLKTQLEQVQTRLSQLESQAKKETNQGE